MQLGTLKGTWDIQKTPFLVGILLGRAGVFRLSFLVLTYELMLTYVDEGMLPVCFRSHRYRL